MVREYGALDYQEFIGNDFFVKRVKSFAKKVKLNRDDLVIAAITNFKSRKHRDDVMKKQFEGPRMAEMMKMKPLFKTKQVVYDRSRTFVSV